MTTPPPSPPTAATGRLAAGYYNSDPVAAANPGGLDGDGHTVNFPAALADLGAVAGYVGTASAWIWGITGDLTVVLAGLADVASARAATATDRSAVGALRDDVTTKASTVAGQHSAVGAWWAQVQTWQASVATQSADVVARQGAVSAWYGQVERWQAQVSRDRAAAEDARAAAQAAVAGVRVSAGDAAPGPLATKLVPGAGVSLALVSAADGSQTLVVAAPLAAGVLSPRLPAGTTGATWMNTEAPVVATAAGGLELSVDGAAWSAGPVTLATGAILHFRFTQGALDAAAHGATLSATLTVDGTPTPLSAVLDKLPDSVAFAAKAGQNPNSAVVADAVTATGFNARVKVWLVSTQSPAVQVQVAGGAWMDITGVTSAAASSVWLAPGDTLAVRHSTGSTPSTTVTTTISLGGVEASFSTTTANQAVQAVAAPTVTNPPAGATGVGGAIVFTASAYTGVGLEAQPHASSDWQLSTAGSFGSLVAQVAASSSAKTSWYLPTGTLQANTTYYVRVRYRSSGGLVSDWSPTVSFTTAASVAAALGYTTVSGAQPIEPTGPLRVFSAAAAVVGRERVSDPSYWRAYMALVSKTSGAVLDQHTLTGRAGKNEGYSECLFDGTYYYLIMYGDAYEGFFAVVKLDASLNVVAQTRFTTNSNYITFAYAALSGGYLYVGLHLAIPQTGYRLTVHVLNASTLTEVSTTMLRHPLRDILLSGVVAVPASSDVWVLSHIEGGPMTMFARLNTSCGLVKTLEGETYIGNTVGQVILSTNGGYLLFATVDAGTNRAYFYKVDLNNGNTVAAVKTDIGRTANVAIAQGANGDSYVTAGSGATLDIFRLSSSFTVVGSTSLTAASGSLSLTGMAVDGTSVWLGFLDAASHAKTALGALRLDALTGSPGPLPNHPNLRRGAAVSVLSAHTTGVGAAGAITTATNTLTSVASLSAPTATQPAYTATTSEM